MMVMRFDTPVEYRVPTLVRTMNLNDPEQRRVFFDVHRDLPREGPGDRAGKRVEVLERKEEFIRTIGPVFGRLESDYIGQVVERGFNILLRAGAFPEPPEALRYGRRSDERAVELLNPL